jgi:hypothetical protein
VLVARAAVLLEYFDRAGRPDDMVSFVDHASPVITGWRLLRPLGRYFRNAQKLIAYGALLF